MKLCIDGARLEPRLYALSLALVDALEQADVAALQPEIRLRFFDNGAIVRDTSTAGDHVWRLTPWAELTLIEIVSLAMRPGLSADDRCASIRLALDLAGYDGRTTR